jgi:hypothetical protein
MNVLRTRRSDAAPAIVLPEEDPATGHLRDESDPDPLVEALTARLRKQFPESLSCDEWGRPVAYRHVIRAALSALPPHVTRELAERLSEHDEPAELSLAYVDLDEPAASLPEPTGTGAPLVFSEPMAHGVGWPEWSPAF